MVADIKNAEAVSAGAQQQSLDQRPATVNTDLSTTEGDASDFLAEQKRPLDADQAEKQANVNVSPSDGENVIFWDGDNDPANPYNWPSWRKVLNCVLVSSLTFLTPLGSCTLPVIDPLKAKANLPTTAMFAPGVPELMKEFGNNSSTLGSFVVSVYVLGFAAGPMIFAPLSEMFGRLPLYHIANVCFFGEFFFVEDT